MSGCLNHLLFEASNAEWSSANSSFCKKAVHKFTSKIEHLSKSKGKAIPYSVTFCIYLLKSCSCPD